MTLWEVSLTAFVALITMVNPLAVVPPFLALTDGALRRRRRDVALIAGVATMGFLVFFLVAGNVIFHFFGITLPAFQIMGGIIFFTNALRTLVDDERRFRNLRPRGPEEVTVEPVDADHADPIGVAIVPLAIPMLCGPGAITSTMLLVNLYPGLEKRLAVIAAIVVVGILSWLVLLLATPLSRVMGERGRMVFTKIMALLLGAIGVQFVLNGIRPVVIDIMRAAG
ncbi:MAG: MarC family protein [Thermoanaerobaculia bacterium]